MEKIKEEMARLDHLFLVVLKPSRDKLEFNPGKLGEILMNITERMQNIAAMLLEHGKLSEEDASALEIMKERLAEAMKSKVHYDSSKPKREQEIVSESGKPLMKIRDLEAFYNALQRISQ